MQVLLANRMERSDDPSLYDGPEPFDGIGMHCTNHILAFRMIDYLVRIFPMQLLVTHPLIGDQQTDLMRHGLIPKAGQRVRLDVRNDSGNYVALALDGSCDDRLSRSRSACAAIST